MRLSRVLALLAAGGLAVAGCSAPGPEEVTFFANGNTIQVVPYRTCDASTPDVKCSADDPSKSGTLKVRPGQPIQISVPGAVATGLWQVAIMNIDANGQALEPQQPKLITSQETYAYTVTPPLGGQQTVIVEVSVLAPQTAAQPDGTSRIVLIPTATWALQVQPV